MVKTKTRSKKSSSVETRSTTSIASAAPIARVYAAPHDEPRPSRLRGGAWHQNERRAAGSDPERRLWQFLYGAWPCKGRRDGARQQAPRQPAGRPDTARDRLSP